MRARPLLRRELRGGSAGLDGLGLNNDDNNNTGNEHDSNNNNNNNNDNNTIIAYQLNRIQHDNNE